jgi:hypothetical protein
MLGLTSCGKPPPLYSLADRYRLRPAPLGLAPAEDGALLYVPHRVRGHPQEGRPPRQVGDLRQERSGLAVERGSGARSEG